MPASGRPRTQARTAGVSAIQPDDWFHPYGSSSFDTVLQARAGANYAPAGTARHHPQTVHATGHPAPHAEDGKYAVTGTLSA